MNENSLNFTGGEADLYLHGGEKATLTNLPGGTSYQVMEETPSGWQIVDQTGAAGVIPANGTAQVSFTNEYVPGTATITLFARKTLDGSAPAEGMFQFTLTDGDGNTQTASNEASGMVTFDQIVYRQPGTYTYTIREVRGDDAGINYDTHAETVTVEVTDDGQGNLTATSSSLSNVPSFENETKPGRLTITKQTDGSGTGEETFIFEIRLTNQYGQSLDNVNIVGGTSH